MKLIMYIYSQKQVRNQLYNIDYTKIVNLIIYSQIILPVSIMKQQIKKYEADLLNNNQIGKLQNNLQYGHYSFQEWRLPDIIKEINERDYEESNECSENKKLIWIGNHKYSCVLAYFYAVLLQCEYCQTLFLQFKQAIYKDSQFYLSLSQQKMLVSFLTKLNHENKLNLLIIDNKHYEQIFVKLFEALYRNKKVSKIIQLIQFSREKFDFVKYDRISQNVLEIKPNNRKNGSRKSINTYIISEKQCFFVYIQERHILKRQCDSENIEINRLNAQQLELQKQKKQEVKMPSFLLKKMNGGENTHHDPNKFKKYAQKCKKRIQLEEKRKLLIDNLKNANGSNKSACNIKIVQPANCSTGHQTHNIKDIIKNYKSLSKQKKKPLKKLNSQQNLLAEQTDQPKQSPRQNSRNRIQNEEYQISSYRKNNKYIDKLFRKSDLQDESHRKRMLSSLEKHQTDQFIKSIQAMRKSTTHYVTKLNEKSFFTSKHSNKKMNNLEQDTAKFFSKHKTTPPKKRITEAQENTMLMRNQIQTN